MTPKTKNRYVMTCKYKFKILIAAILLSLSFTDIAFAAPFCVVTSYGENCWYYDANSCRQAASSTNGACVINNQQAQAPSGGAPFCVVTGYGTNCWYYDANSCRQAAATSNGECVVKR